MPMNPHQVAGHLGAANNPQFSSSTQHASRVSIMESAAQAGSDRSQQSIAGQIGVTTNPQCSSGTQHHARQEIIHAASGKK